MNASQVRIHVNAFCINYLKMQMNTYAFIYILQKMHSAHIFSTVHSVVRAFKRMQSAFFEVCIHCSLHSESEMNARECRFQKMRPRCACVVNAFECRRLNASHDKCGLNAKECFKKCIWGKNHTHSGKKPHHTLRRGQGGKMGEVHGRGAWEVRLSRRRSPSRGSPCPTG